MSMKEELIKIVGSEGFSDSPQILKTYSKDYSLIPPGMPNYVVKPKNVQEIQKIVILANEHKTPIVPCSSSIHFHGTTIPKQGGIILDLTRMNKILEIDEPNKRTRIESGVTWEQIENELEKRELRLVIPLLPHSSRSVVTDYLEREVPLDVVYEYGEPLQSLEVVWPNGDIFRTGSASTPSYPDSVARGVNPWGPGIDFCRLLLGAQGTMGVVSWANVKIEYLPRVNKLMFALFSEMSDAVEPVYSFLRNRIGNQCLLLNNIDLTTILATSWPDGFNKLRATLPPWTLILSISGSRRRPEERIAYEEKALMEIKEREFHDMDISSALPGVPGAGTKLLNMLRKPWPKDVTYWKHQYKGACQDIFFITKPVYASKFIKIVEEVAVKHGYPINDIGCYLQPIESNRACHLEFNFFYNPNEPAEVELISELYTEAIGVLLNQGALFTRPYGLLGKLVYDKAAGYTAALRRVKNIFDPNNIMNPGNLCF
jgi:FAD/FMN-containing dehydrogenase